MPPGRSTSRIVARAAAGSSTTSRTPWQSTDVGAALHQRGQVGQVALEAGDLDAHLAGPAAEGGQGVGAGVDHGDLVTELGEPDREAAGAAADVDDPQAGCSVECALERLPHHRGAGAAATLAGRHDPNPRA